MLFLEKLAVRSVPQALRRGAPPRRFDVDYSSFSDYHFAKPLAATLEKLALAAPTPIQRLAIAPQLAGRDLLGIACTGSGKTAAFGLPLLQLLLATPRPLVPRHCHALVLAPTRELAGQIVTVLRTLAGSSRLRIGAMVGGASRRHQIGFLAGGAHIVVATPGRLLDLVGARALVLRSARHLVIDEADRMLDLGFLDPVRRIAAELAPERQTVMFSATMPAALAQLAGQLLRDPLRVETVPPPAAERRVSARAEIVTGLTKHQKLIEIVSAPGVQSAIVFCRTRRGADSLGRTLAAAGLNAGVMHGERSQSDRSRTLAKFRRGRIGILIATDLVARGIDVPGVSHVINFDLPDDVESYVHRIGRTGRAGAGGEAITFCTPSEIGRLRKIEQTMRQPLLALRCRACGTAAAGRVPDPAPPLRICATGTCRS